MFKIVMFIANSKYAERTTNNRTVALRIFKTYATGAMTLATDDITVILYYKNKRLKTFIKGLDNASKM